MECGLPRRGPPERIADAPVAPPPAAALTASCLAFAAVQCGGPSPAKPLRRSKQRVFVMGFDGMDPTLTSRWMAEGKLPNLKKLSEEGVYRTLGSSMPSESPTAWSSFATGVNPGKHNIYDFLIRSFETYLPDFNMVRKEPGSFLWGLIPTKTPKVISTRGGTSFWKHAGADGVRSVILTVPVTFPAEHIDHGEMLSGLPLPDIRGTLGHLLLLGHRPARLSGGQHRVRRHPEAAALRRWSLGDASCMGPDNPILKQEETALVEEAESRAALREADAAPRRARQEQGHRRALCTCSWTEGSGKVDLEIQGTKLTLSKGEWSRWIPLTFRVNFLVSIYGMTQFYVADADKELRLYASPVNMDPRKSPIPISAPAEFSAELADKVGVYRTLGWAESSDKPLNEGRLDEAAFLYDSERAFDDREKLIFENLKRDDWDLFVAAVETTDRVSHMMWRLIDPKHPGYDEELARALWQTPSRMSTAELTTSWAGCGRSCPGTWSSW